MRGRDASGTSSRRAWRSRRRGRRAGVRMQQFQGEPDQVTAARPGRVAASLARLQRVVADGVEDRADPVPLGDDGHDLRGIEPAACLGLVDLGEPGSSSRWWRVNALK